MHDGLGLAAAFVLTAALHTAVFGVLAAVLDRLLPRGHDGARELAWRIAMFGGFATASLQMWVGIDPLAGSFRPFALEPVRALVPAALEGAPPGAAAPADAGAERVAAAWLDAAVAVALALGAGAVAQLAAGYAGLRRRLSPRTPAPALRAAAAEVAAALSIPRVPAVTTSARAATPLALGVVHPEICVPERAVRDLSGDELRAVLAHELAHVTRHDPAWALLYATTCRLLFWNPILWFARRRLLDLAELRCDAIACHAHPRAGVALARALVHAAEWLAHAPRGVASAHGHAMAATTSGLHRRVQVLLAGAPRRAGAGIAAHAAAVLACSGAAFVLPDASARAAESTIARALETPLPVPLAALVREVLALRAEVDGLRDLLARGTFAGNEIVHALLTEIDRRLQHLEDRCADVIDQVRSLPIDAIPPDLR